MAEYELPAGWWDDITRDHFVISSHGAETIHEEHLQAAAGSHTTRDSLTTALHHNPEGVDTERAEHFMQALGLRVPHYIIVDPVISRKKTHEILEAHGMPPKPVTSAGYVEIDTAIVHPADQDTGHSTEEILVHEMAHRSAHMPGELWEEGWAWLLTLMYQRWRNGAPGAEAASSATYKITDECLMGLGIYANLIAKDPGLFQSMLSVRTTGSAHAYQTFFNQMADHVGIDRFTYLVTRGRFGADPGPTFAVTHDFFPSSNNRITIPLAALDCIAESKISAYEQQAGYSFSPTALGNTALGPQTVNMKMPDADPIASQLRRLAIAFLPSTPS